MGENVWGTDPSPFLSGGKQLREKGVSSAVVLAIVIAIAAVGVGGYLLLKRESRTYPDEIYLDENLIWVTHDQRTGNTAGYYLKATLELTDNDLEILEQYGVYELYPTNNRVIYYGLIVEIEVTNIEALPFVVSVYLPPKR